MRTSKSTPTIFSYANAWSFIPMWSSKYCTRMYRYLNISNVRAMDHGPSAMLPSHQNVTSFCFFFKKKSFILDNNGWWKSFLECKNLLFFFSCFYKNTRVFGWYKSMWIQVERLRESHVDAFVNCEAPVRIMQLLCCWVSKTNMTSWFFWTKVLHIRING